MDYLLGVGDKLLFTQMNEFITSKTQLPTPELDAEYLLGVGDELTLIQLNGTHGGADIDEINLQNNINEPTPLILKTSSVVGTDGNILLLGLGNIKAKNHSLKDIQTKIRNIFIRNGIAPNFQLEITGFNSKKAFVTFPNSGRISKSDENLISITNLPVTLKELVINYGLRSSSKDTVIITLTRDNKKFRMTAGQIFDKSFPRILIKDRDQIEIDEAVKNYATHEAVVGSKGNILLPDLGSFIAVDRSLTELRTDITHALKERGYVPTFQLEITEFTSKKFFLITKNYGSRVIPITNSELDLRDAILSNISTDNSNFNQNGKYFTIIEMVRNGLIYQMSLQQILNGNKSKVFIEDGDTIELKDFEYKPGQVFALSGAGNALMVPITPSKRETLADILFAQNGAFNNLLAKRSEIYLLRGQNPSVAYHLDAQNVSRILVAAKTELRPNDIVYVADRPIITFSRTLAEILPLRILLRDIKENNLP